MRSNYNNSFTVIKHSIGDCNYCRGKKFFAIIDAFCSMRLDSNVFCIRAHTRTHTTLSELSGSLPCPHTTHTSRSLALSCVASMSAHHPTLCLVDVVELPRLDRCMTTATNAASTGRLGGVGAGESPSARLVLEPARSVVGRRADDWGSLRAQPNCYPCCAYYVVHSWGLHLVHLPWLADLARQCERLSSQPTTADPSDDEDDCAQPCDGGLCMCVCVCLSGSCCCRCSGYACDCLVLE